MKKFLLAMAMILLMASALWASPFIISDPYVTTDVQPTVFEMILDSGASVDIVPVTTPTGLIFQYDLTGLTGSHSVQVRACSQDDLGRYCSDYAPFAFTLISAPQAPRLRLRR